MELKKFLINTLLLISSLIIVEVFNIGFKLDFSFFEMFTLVYLLYISFRIDISLNKEK